MGTVDKVLRIAFALLIGGLYAAGQISGMLAIVVLVFAVVFIATSLLGTCPLYLPFGISTIKK